MGYVSYADDLRHEPATDDAFCQRFQSAWDRGSDNAELVGDPAHQGENAAGKTSPQDLEQPRCTAPAIVFGLELVDPLRQRVELGFHPGDLLLEIRNLRGHDAHRLRQRADDLAQALAM